MKTERVIRPMRKSKTRTKIRPDTVLKNFPLFYPKYKPESLICIKESNTSVIEESVA